MIRSMTAFAQREIQYDWGSISWEIRSVNHRYLEQHNKLPELFRALEPQLREHLRKTLARGKVDYQLRYQLNQQQEQSLDCNLDLSQQLINLVESIEQQQKQIAPTPAIEILRWPGVIKEPKLDTEQIHQDSFSAFVEAVENLIASREREGQDLKQLIEQRLDAIDATVVELRSAIPTILANQQQKLRQKVEEIQAELDPARLEQELVIMMQKADVDEELDRLVTHTKEVRRVLSKGGSCGRRLDFLMQELNREANTLSSKSVHSDSTQAAVELKVLIEQMREQIQNIE